MKIFFTRHTLTIVTAALVSSLALAMLTPGIRQPGPGVCALAETETAGADTALARQYVAKGDAYLKARDYLNAKASYQMAVSQNPGDESAKEKLRSTMELLRSQKAQNILFDVAISAADKLYQAGEYDKALKEYENAGKLLPNDPYPRNRINEILKLQVDRKVKAEEYAKAIAQADKAYAAKNWQGALLDYKKALGINPEEKYPQERMAELTTLIADQKARDEAYARAIAAGDQSFQEIKYPDAIASYRDALKVKPEQSYPKDRIREAETLIARNAKARADYDRYVALADSLYIEKKYMQARENYLSASAARPSESYPREMVAKADRMLTGQEAAMARALEEQYAKILANADQLLSEKQNEPARAEYLKASNLKPAEQYPKDRVAEIDLLLANMLKDKEDRYRQAIEAGDKALAGRVLELARSEYQAALDMKPAESYPKTKLAEVARLMETEAAHKAADARYANSLSRADSLFIEKAYLASKAEFQNASRMKPEEVYPKNRIREIDQLIGEIEKQKKRDALAAIEAEKRNLEAGYRSVLVRADSLFALKSYDAARFEYQTAAGLKPVEAYPKKKMTEIDATLAAIKDRENRYGSLIKKGDDLLAGKSYVPARDAYREASTLKPEETYPKDRISEIETALASLAAAKALDDQYAGIVAGADKLWMAKEYTQAKEGYRQALQLKPGESYPQNKITEIDRILAELDAMRDLDDRYKAAVAAGDDLFSSQSWEPAKTEYQKASGLKPEEKYPKTKIAEIDAALAEIARLKALDDEYANLVQEGDKLFADKAYERSRETFRSALVRKPAEQYPKDRITEIDKKLAELAAIRDRDDRYAAAVKNGDQLLSRQDYNPARQAYTEASALKPEEKYPKEKISEIDAVLSALAAARALDEKYTAVVASADQAMAAKDHSGARTGYQEATGLKPGEKYPKEKLAEIDRVLADLEAARLTDAKYNTALAEGDRLLNGKKYEEAKPFFTTASGLKPAEQYPKSKIEEIDAAVAEIARLQELDREYSAAVAGADKSMADQAYLEAKTGYEKALTLKPAETYPKTRISEITAILADQARMKAIEEQYSAALAGADKLFGEKSYEQARTAYLEAGKIKPTESYPKTKVAEIDTLVDALARQKALDDRYKALLAKADQLLSDLSWEPARAEYANALTLKPEEKYPKDKMAEIDAALAEIKAQEEAFQAVLKTADGLLAQKNYQAARPEYEKALVMKPGAAYPRGKIAEIDKALEELLGKQKYYENLIADADKSLTEKDYPRAKEVYQQALSVFPDETYPKQRISLITARVDSIYRANRAGYEKAVAEGDRYFNTFEFDKAVDAYTEAAVLLPMEKYPKEMILKIRRTIEENAIVDILKTPLIITSNNEKQFSFTPVNVASRKNNFVYIRIRNLSGKPFNVLMRYGRDKQSNGGVVMRNLSVDGKMNERLVSVRDQDLWSREDNNWISLYPQGGDVEVSFIQVSRAQQ